MGEWGRAGCIDYDVVGFTIRCEILRCVIDYMVGPKRSHQPDVLGTAYPCHVGTEMLGKLHRCCAYSSGSASMSRVASGAIRLLESPPPPASPEESATLASPDSKP